MSPVLSLRGLSKRYRIRNERSFALGLSRRSRPEDVWALTDVDLDVEAGEVVAVIGRNGAGKSTMLKLAAGVVRPTRGTLHRPARIAPLIEVGAGFHPDLSGRENVAVNARLLGLSGREIRAAFDDIVDFADLAHAIDQPVRQYSSGMFMRLGFSVAVHTRPELLIVDEVLAVGDLPFQAKCLERIELLRSQGVAVLFVSHNLSSVQSLADRALLLERGRPLGVGTSSEMIERYYDTLSGAGAAAGSLTAPAPAGAVVVSHAVLETLDGEIRRLWRPGEECRLRVTLRALQDLPPLVFGYQVHKDGAGTVAHWLAPGPPVPALDKGQSLRVDVRLRVNLGAGAYRVVVALATEGLSRVVLPQTPVGGFTVAEQPGELGMVHLGAHVDVVRLEAESGEGDRA